MQIFDVLLVKPIINLLVIFYHGLTYVHIPYALGFSIILLTVFIRLLMYPLTAKQLQVSKKMQELAPHMAKIKEKHKGDAKRQQEATMALYQEHKINPAAGCLPMLIQIVVLIFGLYPTLMKIVNLKAKEIVTFVNHAVYVPNLQIHQAWDTSFFGLTLGHTPGQLWTTVGPLILLVPIATGFFQFLQSKMMAPVTPNVALTVKSDKQDDFATTFQKQSLYLLPVMIGFFSWNFSIGLSLYWNTFTIFGIIQQYQVSGLGGLSEWIKVKK
ncbi:MAG TPA: YidC/Oxa1 family membrane protein insertase [Patescibacteria group bacterium]